MSSLLLQLTEVTSDMTWVSPSSDWNSVLCSLLWGFSNFHPVVVLGAWSLIVIWIREDNGWFWLRKRGLTWCPGLSTSLYSHWSGILGEYDFQATLHIHLFKMRWLWIVNQVVVIHVCLHILQWVDWEVFPHNSSLSWWNVNGRGSHCLPRWEGELYNESFI